MPETRDCSFPRHYRLANSGQFQRVFAEPLKSSDRYLTVLARPGEALGARLGLVITKKRLRHAVDRNRIKRLTRESFRHHRHQLDNLDVLVLARSEVRAASNAVLFVSLEKHWQRLARLCVRS